MHLWSEIGLMKSWEGEVEFNRIRAFNAPLNLLGYSNPTTSRTFIRPFPPWALVSLAFRDGCQQRLISPEGMSVGFDCLRKIAGVPLKVDSKLSAYRGNVPTLMPLYASLNTMQKGRVKTRARAHEIGSFRAFMAIAKTLF